MGGLFWIIWVDQTCNHKCPMKEAKGTLMQRECDVKLEQGDLKFWL